MEEGQKNQNGRLPKLTQMEDDKKIEIGDDQKKSKRKTTKKN